MECIFCSIAKSRTGIIYETDMTTAFNDIRPKAPIHLLLIPKRHISTISELDRKEAHQIFKDIAKLAIQSKISNSGYRIVCNQGSDAGQEIDHLHFHILGGGGLHHS